MSFEEMLDQSFKSTYTGEKVKAVVTSVAPNEITVDIGTKHTGYVPLAELTSDPSLKPEDIVKKGDEIELVVLRVNDVEGTVMLSKKRLDAQAGFEKVMAAAGTGEVLSGTVTDVVKGGVLAITEGVKVFIPASLSGVSKNEPLEQLLKQKVDFVIREVNEKRHRAVGSIKDVLKEQKKALEEKFWGEVEVGKRYQGVVKSLTSYGAFVDLGGVDGMVHISELSWLRIKHPSDVVKVGDVLDVYVKDGKVLKVEGTPDHPVNHGFLCTKGVNNRQYLYRKDRILTPLRRVGKRGEKQFVPISWEEAIEEISEKLLGYRDQYGVDSVAFFSGYGKW